MATISRNDFVQNLNRRGGYIDLNRMNPQTSQALHDAGITDEQLREAAGRDHVIRGATEFQNLFRKVDALDRNGSSRSIQTQSGADLTRSGQAYEALLAEADRNRSRAARQGGRRFSGDATLDRVADGNATLSEGDNNESVRRVQRSLIDLGFDIPTNGASGTFDVETKRAVERFQREMGLGIDGTVGAETLGALAATAPPPGQRLERSAEYDRLYADGRLDVTIALGWDEHEGYDYNARGLRDTMSGLRDQGYRRIDPSRMTAERRAELGLGGDRFDPNAQYFHRQFQDPQTGNDVDAVVRLIVPDGTNGAEARQSFERAMEQDEVVIYSGHARYGTGPDFDDIGNGAGNFVVDPHGNRRGSRPPAGLRGALSGRRDDLRGLNERPDYQLCIFNACKTENYLHNLRESGAFDRTHGNTDIVATSINTRLLNNGSHATRFLQGVTSRENNRQMLGANSRIEQDTLRSYSMDGVEAAGATYTESGFIGNTANRNVPR